MRVVLKFAYDGRPFSGYARQPNQKTVEGDLLGLLTDHSFIVDAKQSRFRTASRTDRGVSALGNVCAFNTTASKKQIINTLSKEKQAPYIYAIKNVDPEFFPRYAKRREYRYYLKKNDLDVDRVVSAASVFTGEHNFQNFARVEPLKDPIRSLDNIIISEKNEFLVIDFYAQTFLWNQIRRIISALEKVGNESLTLKQVQDALDHPEKKVDFQLAAAEPLILLDVVYDFSFEYTKGYKKKLQRIEEDIVTSLG